MAQIVNVAWLPLDWRDLPLLELLVAFDEVIIAKEAIIGGEW